MFRLTIPKKKAFLEKVDSEGRKASEVLNELIDNYIERRQSPGIREVVGDLESVVAKLQKVSV